MHLYDKANPCCDDENPLRVAKVVEYAFVGAWLSHPKLLCQRVWEFIAIALTSFYADVTCNQTVSCSWRSVDESVQCSKFKFQLSFCAARQKEIRLNPALTLIRSLASSGRDERT